MFNIRETPNQPLRLALSGICIMVFAGFFSQASATDTTQVGSDTLKLVDTVPSFTVNVTYYDFHQDGSNPEFEHKLNLKRFGRLNSGLVQDTLDSFGYPLPNPAVVDSGYLIEYVNRWFRPWVPGDTLINIFPAETSITSRADSSAPPETIVTFFGTIIQYPQKIDTNITPADTIRSDTLMKNIAIEDSLVFNKYRYVKIEMAGLDSTFKLKYDTTVYEDVYQVDHMHNSFLPIDGRGFPNPPGDTSVIYKHNYSFAMKMENTFTYKSGQILRVMGDDDIWVFINRRLAIDIGGLHETIAGEINLDTMAVRLGITLGGNYSIVLFMAERHSTGSNLSVVTNIQFDQKRVGNSVFERYVVPTIQGSETAKQVQPKQKMVVKIGPAMQLFSMPDKVSRIRAELFDAGGRKVSSAQQSATTAVRNGFQINKKLHSGMYLVRLTCFDTTGKVRGSVAQRALMIP